MPIKARIFGAPPARVTGFVIAVAFTAIGRAVVTYAISETAFEIPVTEAAPLDRTGGPSQPDV